VKPRLTTNQIVSLKIVIRRAGYPGREPLLLSASSSRENGSTPVFAADRLLLATSIILLLAAAIAWFLTFGTMPPMGGPSTSVGMGVGSIVTSLSLRDIGLFEFTWVVGMVAMMFPAMIPVIAFYNRVIARQERDPAVARVVGTPLFLAGYLAIYAVLGLAAYVVVFAALSLSLDFQGLSEFSLVAPGFVLILAGVYQLSPLKLKALSHCVSSFGFFALHSRTGLLGSARMGFHHGIYCVGCCWAYMLVMLAVAAMSLPSMAILAAVIALEKVILRGAAWFNKTIAAGFITLGMAALLSPNILTIL